MQRNSLAIERIIKFQGGLGNQMFQYALSLRLKHDGYAPVRYDTEYYSYCDPHYGFELERIFGVKCKGPGMVARRIFKSKKLTRLLVKYLYDYNDTVYEMPVEGLLRPVKYYDGYWQNENYFKKVESLVRKSFVFNELSVAPQNREMAQRMAGESSVSLHVRRGDYLSCDILCDVCGVEYFRRAIEYMRSILGEQVRFYLFSDDLEWVAKNLDVPNATYVEHNRGLDSWQDMYLMSSCKHHIIANSSFSWWGAWLNPSPEKIVVAPDKWFNHKEYTEIIPDSWVKIETK